MQHRQQKCVLHTKGEEMQMELQEHGASTNVTWRITQWGVVLCS